LQSLIQKDQKTYSWQNCVIRRQDGTQIRANNACRTQFIGAGYFTVDVSAV